MPPYGKGKSTQICAEYAKYGKCNRRNCHHSHGGGGGGGDKGGGGGASAPQGAVPKASSVLVAMLKLLFQKEQFTIFNADEGRLNLTAFKECPDVVTVQDSIDFNTAAFCEALCEVIAACLGSQMTILQLDRNDIRTFKPFSSALMRHNLHSSIVSLSIANNLIGTFDVLSQLKPFGAMRELVLQGNPVGKDPNTLKRVRHALPQLLGFDRESVVRPPLALPWPVPGDDPSITRTADEQGLIQYLGNSFFSRINAPPPEGGTGQFGANQLGGGSSVVDGLAEVYHNRAIFTFSFTDGGNAAMPTANGQQQNKDATRDVHQFRQKHMESNHNICKGIKSTAIAKGKIEVLSKMSSLLYPNKSFFFTHTFSPSINVSFVNGGAMSGGVAIATVAVHGTIRYQHKVHSSCTFERIFHRSLVLVQDNNGWLITNDAIELRPQTDDPIFISFSQARSEKVGRKAQVQLGSNCGNGLSTDVAQAAALICTSDFMWMDVLLEIGILDNSVFQECMTLANGDVRAAIMASRVVARSFMAARQAGNGGGGMGVAEALQRLSDGEWNVEAVMPLN